MILHFVEILEGPVRIWGTSWEAKKSWKNVILEGVGFGGVRGDSGSLQKYAGCVHWQKLGGNVCFCVFFCQYFA